ncbi:BioY family transporter [Halalkalibacillus sediminis]|uniref:Biotin transporter n=1 Tax=Halalkalibacillus sediminis TaxID=2018042 RepID=A0A2I0QUW0_9BACI|nr:biotin transporter BioY [Halalkalibacillus sediminis]PKR78116.1 BioY family transporter [Halalkalibacillus sediminis]
MKKRPFRTVELTLGAVFVVLMMIGANIAIWFPALRISYGAGEVPLTLQTFFAILAGILLGKKLGAFSMIVYLLVGIVGVPVFAEMKSGVAQLAMPTGGFLISFIFVAFVAGYIVEKGSKSSIMTYLLATFAGLLVNYLIGTPYMWYSMNYVLEVGITLWGATMIMVPFFIKDFIITMLFALLLPQFVTRLTKASPSLARQ